MPTITACIQCQAKFSVPRAAIGKRATCSKCGQKFVVVELPPAASKVAPSKAAPHSIEAKKSNSAGVSKQARVGTAAAPAAEPQPAKTPARLTEAELLAAFAASMVRSRLPWSYRLGILLAAIVMVALVFSYLALIAAACYATYYHAVHNTWIAEIGGIGRARLFMMLVYAAPLFAGPVLIFFMVKPLLARPAQQERSRSLTRMSEPLLFIFVDRLCQTIGAPQPKRIDVDCQVNASAGFRRGLWSMLGKDLVLTIGLPLLGSLTMREFGGVLAHELGHFSQGAGMRLTYLVQRISHWFVRVVYQRDAWDERLEVLASELDFRIGWVVLLAQLGVLIGRGVLWLLMHIGFLVAGVLLRQMEFDADCAEIGFSGSEAFATTARKLQILGAAVGLAHAQATEHLDGRRLVEDFPGLIQLNARTMPPQIAADIEKSIAESRTGWFDTHPSDSSRLAAAEKLACPGVFRLERPARELLSDFSAQSRATTWGMYLASFGPNVPREALVPVAEFARAAQSRWKEPGSSRDSGHHRSQ